MNDPVWHEVPEALFARIAPAFPAFSELEQRIGLELYRLLAEGEPVAREQLATAVGYPTRDVVGALEAGLRNLVLYDDRRRVRGFGGLSVTPTSHQLWANGVRLFTWCAWDTLFIPELLGAECTVESRCPETDELLHIALTPDRIEDVRPAGTVMSFVIPTSGFSHCPTSERIAGFCDHVHFLAGRQAADAWARHRPRTLLVSLADAFVLARMLNAARYPTVALRRGTGSGPLGHDLRQEGVRPPATG